MTDGLYSNPQEVYAYQTISMHSAVYAGGYGTITTKYRLQEQTDGSGWVNLTGWQSGIPTYDVSQSSPTETNLDSKHKVKMKLVKPKLVTLQLLQLV